jgi:hypothetical protein
MIKKFSKVCDKIIKVTIIYRKEYRTYIDFI